MRRSWRALGLVVKCNLRYGWRAMIESFSEMAIRQIQLFREQTGISNRKLARIAGISEQAVRRLGDDTRLSTVRRIERAMREFPP